LKEDSQGKSDEFYTLEDSLKVNENAKCASICPKDWFAQGNDECSSCYTSAHQSILTKLNEYKENKKNTLEQAQSLESEIEDILKDNHQIWLDLTKNMEYMDEFEGQINKAEDWLNQWTHAVFYHLDLNGRFNEFLSMLKEANKAPKLYKSNNTKN